MKITLNKNLKEKVSRINSRVIEPAKFEKWRTHLIGWSIVICMVWMPVKFLFFTGAGFKSTFFICGITMTGFFLLSSMIQPGSKSFWLLFLNLIITLPIVVLYFPFKYFLNMSSIFEALFGLLPLWIPIIYMVFLTWKNLQLRIKHKNEITENVQMCRNIKLKV